eukprot:GHVN01082830.1.p1 GENE.GHVN01082830.1~~GHVN01082830.1.p1  ORF type:complete len:433 (+),score=80.81 GHVN01082830.1:104-1300(+)
MLRLNFWPILAAISLLSLTGPQLNLVFALTNRVPGGSKGWAAAEFPKPEGPSGLKACGFGDKSLTSERQWMWLCDPDERISFDARMRVQHVLENLYETTRKTDPVICEDGSKQGIQVGFAIMSHMEPNPTHPTSLSHRSTEWKRKSASGMAKDIGDIWGVGHPGCNNGAMILAALEDRYGYIEMARKVTLRLPSWRADQMFGEVGRYLKARKFDEGLVTMVEKISYEIINKINADRNPPIVDTEKGLYLLFCALVIMTVFVPAFTFGTLRLLGFTVFLGLKTTGRFLRSPRGFIEGWRARRHEQRVERHLDAVDEWLRPDGSAPPPPDGKVPSTPQENQTTSLKPNNGECDSESSVSRAPGSSTTTSPISKQKSRRVQCVVIPSALPWDHPSNGFRHF